MRIKIIAVNALIMAVVGLMSFWLMRSQIVAATSDKTQISEDAKRKVQGAAALLQLDGLRAERWLAAKAGEPATVEPLLKASPSARSQAATVRCDEIASQTKGSAQFDGTVPTLVAIIDRAGKIIGRNGSELARGEDLAALYSGLKTTLANGNAGSDVWVDKDKYLASYVPVFDKGQIAGALVIGRPLNDTLSHVAEQTTGKPLAIAVAQGEKVEVAARSAATSAAMESAISQGAQTIRTVLANGHSNVITGADLLVSAAPLEGLGDGKRAVLVAALPVSLIDNASSLPWPVLLATLFGIVLIVIAGWLLGSYITQPVNMLEEGLLAILNGQTDRRFELNHAELGGLAFRIDQLLNQLMGVEEDTTDAEGRVSRPPNAASFKDAMSVEDKRGDAEGGVDPATVARLASEPADQYYARLYREYIQAKRAIGEPTDHITEAAFATRIQGMEKDATNKYGRPVRYHVQARGREVVLLAVPL